MRKIAAITMARNEEHFLAKWIAYYGKQFGEENLYIFLDGEDQSIPSYKGNSNIVRCPKIEAQRSTFDKQRMAFLSEQAALLFQKGYQAVVGCDTDEFLVVDPILGVTLQDYLLANGTTDSLSALGVDVGQNLTQEQPIDWNKPFLQQRANAVLLSRYTKAVVLKKPLRWGSGFHRVKGKNFHIDNHLYLFHFGGFDKAFVESKYKDESRMRAGWRAHTNRRLITTQMVSTQPAVEGDACLRKARLLQTYLRKPYALNKPSMAWWKCVITIPNRFKDVL